MKNYEKVDIIIQARLGSTRLPGKILYKIFDKTILAHVIDRLKKCKNVSNIIIATTKNQNDKLIEDYCKTNKIAYFRGDEYDVLDRYYKTAIYFKSKYIVRITSDCPLIDPIIVDKMIDYFFENNKKFLNMKYFNNQNGAHGGFPDGTNMYIFTIEDLEDAWKNTNDKFDREHVCPYMIRKYKFNKKYDISLPKKYKNINFKTLHLSLDTILDYYLIKNIYENLYFISKNFTIYDVLNYLDKNSKLLAYQK